MKHPVLEEDWSEYDNRKITDDRDRSKFSCTEDWEVDYLASKMKKYYPQKKESEIKTAIFAICLLTQGKSHERDLFVDELANQLKS